MMHVIDQGNRNISNGSTSVTRSLEKSSCIPRDDDRTPVEKDHSTRATRVRIQARRAFYYQSAGALKRHLKQDIDEYISSQIRKAFTERSQDRNDDCGNPKSSNDTPTGIRITMVDSPMNRSCRDTKNDEAITTRVTPRVESNSNLATAATIASTAASSCDGPVSTKEKGSNIYGQSLPRTRPLYHYQKRQTRRELANPHPHSMIHHGPYRLPHHDAHPRRQYDSMKLEHHRQKVWLLQQQRIEREQREQRTRILSSKLFGRVDVVPQPMRTTTQAPSEPPADMLSNTRNIGEL
eukprot:jgi/Psemu1/306520/fgenesh1_kg.262_\